MTRVLPVLMLMLGVAAEASAQMSYGRAPRVNKEPELPPGVEVIEHRGDTIPLDLTFHDHFGKPIALRDCVGGKPTVLVLAYFTCPKLCTEVLNGLVGEMNALKRFDLRAGKQFNVVTVSINPKDAPTFARLKRDSYLNEYDKRPDTEDGWWFLTASHGQGTNLLEAEQTIHKLADAVGFKYAPDNHKQYEQANAEPDEAKRALKLETAIRKTKDYVHPSVVMVLTPEGKISQYFHGLPKPVRGASDLGGGYTAEDLRKSLGEANGGVIGSKLDNYMIMNCFAYDDHSGTYKFYMPFLKWAALPFAFFVPGIAFIAWRRSRKEKLEHPPVAPAESGGNS